jgi:myo-inositol-1-phosphate synthase
MDNEINNIMRLARAITATGKYHCFVDYSGHVEWLTVRVLHGDTDYQARAENPMPEVMTRFVVLDRANAVDALIDLAVDMGKLLKDATMAGTVRVQMPRMQA